MTLSMYNPTRLIDRLFEEVEKGLQGQNTSYKPSYSPAIDVTEEKTAYQLRTELPGVAKEDVKVEVKENTLIVSGEKKELNSGTEREENSYRYRESVYGNFSRSFTLPRHVDTTQINAEFKDGVLTLRLPKKPDIGARQIEVK